MEKRPRVGSAVLVKDGDKFLLAKRNKENYKDYWVIPGGGVGFGERISDAAVREIKEETNLDVELVRFLCFREIINVPGDYHGVVFFHLAKPKHRNVKVGDDASEARFVTVDEMKKLKLAESVKEVMIEGGFWN